MAAALTFDVYLPRRAWEAFDDQMRAALSGSHTVSEVKRGRGTSFLIADSSAELAHTLREHLRWLSTELSDYRQRDACKQAVTYLNELLKGQPL